MTTARRTYSHINLTSTSQCLTIKMLMSRHSFLPEYFSCNGGRNLSPFDTAHGKTTFDYKNADVPPFLLTLNILPATEDATSSLLTRLTENRHASKHFPNYQKNETSSIKRKLFSALLITVVLNNVTFQKEITLSVHKHRSVFKTRALINRAAVNWFPNAISSASAG